MIKNLPTTFKHRIIYLYNKILSSHIPQLFKLSLVPPILKPQKPQTYIKSYRPISLNLCLAKILDKIIAKRLWCFVLNNDLIHNSLIGLRRKPVLDSLLYVDHLAFRTIALKKHLTIISLDFTKAFDKIGMHTVIQQTTSLENKCSYVINIMTNGKVIVKTDTNLSNTFPRNDGIPQGSPISVILFLLAYNSLTNIISPHRN